MNNPLISVIVPIYKVEKYLDRCIDSIVNQTYDNLEIILVDDGSPDNCPTICDNWAQKDNRIKVIHKKNAGVSAARNTGLDCSNGEYIAFVDSDDYLDYKMYEKLYKAIINYNVSVSECAIIRESENGYTEYWGRNSSDSLIRSKDEVLKSILLSRDFLIVHSCNKLINKELLHGLRFNEHIKNNEDVLFLFQLFLNSEKYAYLEQSLYHYTIRASSASHKREPDTIFDELKVMDMLYELSPKYLNNYCIYGDIIRSYSKIEELIVSDALSFDVLKMLRKRILKHKLFIFFSSDVSFIIKIKSFLVMISPNLFKLLYSRFAKKINKEMNKKMYE